jgi:hypothetical protein
MKAIGPTTSEELCNIHKVKWDIRTNERMNGCQTEKLHSPYYLLVSSTELRLGSLVKVLLIINYWNFYGRKDLF